MPAVPTRAKARSSRAAPLLWMYGTREPSGVRREGLPAAVSRRSARMRSAAAAFPRLRRKRKAAHSAVPSLSQSSQVSAGAPVHQLCAVSCASR